MKHKLKLVLLFLALVCGRVFPQGFTAGIHSGINISDIHANSTSGKWKFKPGPYQGAFFAWNLNRVVGLTGGLDYSTVYYERVTADPYYPPYIYSSSSSVPYLSDLWLRVPESFDYNIISLPLQLQLRVSSRPDLNLSAGVFYSFVSRRKNYGRASEQDFGYIFSSGWSYPISESFKGILNVSYVTGKREISDYGQFRHGWFNFSVGLSYKLGDAGKNYHSADSSANNLRIVYLAGVNASWNGVALTGAYSHTFGPHAGFRLEIPFEKHAYLVTGLSFERAGYSLRDSSDVYYAVKTVKNPLYFVDTKIGTDYATIPVLLQVTPGRNERFYVATGPYVSVKLNGRITGYSYSHQNTGNIYQHMRTTVHNDVEKLFKGNDFGWSFGAGLNFPVFGLDGEFGLQYRRGFRDVFDESFLPPVGGGYYRIPVKNRLLTVHFGIRIPSK